MTSNWVPNILVGWIIPSSDTNGVFTSVQSLPFTNTWQQKKETRNSNLQITQPTLLQSFKQNQTEANQQPIKPNIGRTTINHNTARHHWQEFLKSRHPGFSQTQHHQLPICGCQWWASSPNTGWHNQSLNINEYPWIA